MMSVLFVASIIAVLMGIIGLVMRKRKLGSIAMISMIAVIAYREISIFAYYRSEVDRLREGFVLNDKFIDGALSVSGYVHETTLQVWLMLILIFIIYKRAQSSEE